MAYRALYREWRPKDFSHVVGQDAIISTLRNQVISGRIAHAYLFCGSRGTGKTSTAKILARAVNCEHPVDGDPCGTCENCLRAEREETLDVIEIDAASNNGVDEIRELRDSVKYPPQYGRYKIYIIDEVHMLSTSAFNALLKTLEEPPEHVVFILATTEPQKLPETILSRCQRFDFGRISMTNIAGRLKEAADGSEADVTDGALMMIARAADGGMRDALSILDTCLGYSNKIDEGLVRTILGTNESSFLFDFCDCVALSNLSGVFSLIDRLMRDGKDPAVFAKDLCRHIRALIIAKSSPEDLSVLLEISPDESREYIRQGEKFTLTRLMSILDIYMSLETEMRYASTPRMALENASIRSCLKTKETDTQALLDRISELENRIVQMEERLKTLNESGIHQPAELPIAPVKPKKEERKPQPVQRKALENADAVSVWNELMARVQKADMSLWSFLSQGHPVSFEDHVLCWMPEEKNEQQHFIIAAMNKPEKKKLIESLLQEITGADSRFSTEEIKSETAKDDSDDSYLAGIYETFGKNAVQIVDE